MILTRCSVVLMLKRTCVTPTGLESDGGAYRRGFAPYDVGGQAGQCKLDTGRVPLSHVRPFVEC